MREASVVGWARDAHPSDIDDRARAVRRTTAYSLQRTRNRLE